MNYNKQTVDIMKSIKWLIYTWKKIQKEKDKGKKKKLNTEFNKRLKNVVTRVDSVIKQFEKNLYKLNYNASLLNANGVKGFINTNGNHFVVNQNQSPPIARMKKILNILSKTNVNGVNKTMNNLKNQVNMSTQTNTGNAKPASMGTQTNTGNAKPASMGNAKPASNRVNAGTNAPVKVNIPPPPPPPPRMSNFQRKLIEGRKSLKKANNFESRFEALKNRNNLALRLANARIKTGNTSPKNNNGAVRNRLASLEAEIASLRGKKGKEGKVAKLKRAKNGLIKQVRNLEKQRNQEQQNAAKNVANLRVQLANAQKAGATSANLTGLRAELDVAKQELEATKTSRNASLAAKTAELNAEKAKAANLNARLQTAIAEKGENSEDAKKLRAELASRNSRLEATALQVANLSRGKEHLIRSFRQKLNAEKAKAANLNAKLQTAINEKGAKSQAANELRAKLEAANANKLLIEAKLANAGRNLAAKNTAHDAVVAQLKQLENSLANAEQKARNAEASKSATEQEKNKLLIEQREKALQLNQKLQQALANKNLSANEKGKLKKKLIASRWRMAGQVTRQVKNAQNLANQAGKAHGEEKRKLEEQLSKALANAQNQVESVRQQQELVVGATTAQKQEVNAKLALAEQELAELKSKRNSNLSTKERTIANLQNNLANAKAGSKNAERIKRELENAKLALSAKNEASKANVNRLTAELANAKAGSKNAERIKRELENAKLALSAKNEASKANVNRLTAELANAKEGSKNADRIRQELENAKEAQARLEASNAAKASELAIRNSRLANAQRQINRSRETNANTQRKIQNIERRLANATASATEKNRLKAELERLQKNTSNLFRSSVGNLETQTKNASVQKLKKFLKQHGYERFGPEIKAYMESLLSNIRVNTNMLNTAKTEYLLELLKSDVLAKHVAEHVANTMKGVNASARSVPGLGKEQTTQRSGWLSRLSRLRTSMTAGNSNAQHEKNVGELRKIIQEIKTSKPPGRSLGNRASAAPSFLPSVKSGNFKNTLRPYTPSSEASYPRFGSGGSSVLTPRNKHIPTFTKLPSRPSSAGRSKSNSAAVARGARPNGQRNRQNFNSWINQTFTLPTFNDSQRAKLKKINVATRGLEKAKENAHKTATSLALQAMKNAERSNQRENNAASITGSVSSIHTNHGTPQPPKKPKAGIPPPRRR